MTVWFRSFQNIQKRKKILKTLDARSKKPRGGRLTCEQSLPLNPLDRSRITTWGVSGEESDVIIIDIHRNTPEINDL